MEEESGGYVLTPVGITKDEELIKWKNVNAGSQTLFRLTLEKV